MYCSIVFYIGCCLSLGIGLLGSYGDHSDDEGKKA